MNKYIVRTSLVWIAVIASAVAFYLYRGYKPKQRVAPSGEVQPAAVGPVAPGKNENKSNTNPNTSAEVPLTSVQLTPERMQSIGVETGTVVWKQISDNIRATGTVDIDERLISYVQVRFSGYIRKVFANATYQYVKKGEPLVIMEAMKMEHTIAAPADGTVKEIHYAAGEQVLEGAELIKVE